jgi:undecaprenyl-diphosphatase
MSTIEAIFLGIIQGITEFFPVSSSGHLQLAQSLLGLNHLDHLILFNLVCHLGTLLAIFCVFSEQIKRTLLTDHTRLIQLCLAILPLFPLLLIMKPIKALFSDPQYLGYFFLMTAFLLYMGVLYERKASEAQLQNNRWRDALTIGVFQAFAILPGVSRSGATIAIGRRLGWTYQDAASFSFLLAIPTICGGTIIELLQLWKGTKGAAADLPVIGWIQYSAAFFTSFFIGYLALSWLMKVAVKGKFIYFVWYCLAVGIFSLFYFNPML